MNRTIKFRGKRVDGKGWVYGTPVYYISGEVSLFTGLCPKVGYEATRISAMRNQVIPETVGQFTGVEDKNDREVFDGDILTDNVGNDGVVKWETTLCRFVILWDNAEAEDLIQWIHFGIEITGNIHDND